MSKENRKINFIIRGILLLMFLVAMPFCAVLTSCTEEEREIEHPTDLPKVEKLIVKKRQRVGQLEATTVDYKGHDVVVIAGHAKHFDRICEKCRKEMGLPPN